MEVYSEERDGVVMVAIEGEVDGSSASLLKDKILPLITENCRMLIDMNQVSFMSSAGLRIMLLISREITQTSGEVVLVGLLPEIHDAMDATGFLKYFKLADSFEAGVEVLSN
ncbi:MAG: STAS domain-containing protein [Chloroflexota bacterium]